MINKEQVKEGGIRLLTSGEIALASAVFKTTVQYHTVWIHHKSYLPFNLQNKNTAMTPNGEMYFRDNYHDDFSTAMPTFQHLFIHEMSHVWQRAKGMNVIARGLFSGLVSYRYQLNGRLLSEYPMEQQAQIIADFFTLQKEDYDTWIRLRNFGDITLDGDIDERIIRQLYNEALRGFPW